MGLVGDRIMLNLRRYFIIRKDILSIFFLNSFLFYKDL